MEGNLYTGTSLGSKDLVPNPTDDNRSEHGASGESSASPFSGRRFPTGLVPAVRHGDYEGIGVADGLVKGTVVVLPRHNSNLNNENRWLQPAAIPFELERFKSAVLVRREKLDSDSQFGSMMKLILDDLEKEGTKFIGLGMSASHALSEHQDKSNAMYGPITQTQGFLADIDTIYKALLNDLDGEDDESILQNLPENTILVGEHITQAQIEMLKPQENIIGFVTKVGGAREHAIMTAADHEYAAIMNIPGLPLGSQKGAIKTGMPIIVDGTRGLLWVNPDLNTVAWFNRQLPRRIEATRAEKVESNRVKTLNGKHEVRIGINISSTKTIKKLQEVFPKGNRDILLVRSELILTPEERKDEEKQLARYLEILEAGEGKANFRTLDWGGDKLEFSPDAPNPMLAERGIRVSLLEDQHEEFGKQINALLRASAHGKVTMTLPMISDAGEVKQVLKLIERAKSELDARTAGDIPGQEYNEDNFSLGVMFETAAAVLEAPRILGIEAGSELSGKIKSVSIGTNDLAQYVLAWDRSYVSSHDSSHTLERRFREHHPANLRALKGILTLIEDHNSNTEDPEKHISVNICGDMASKPFFIPLLIGYKVASVSLSVRGAFAVSKEIRHLSLERCEDLASNVDKADSPEETLKLLSDFNRALTK